MEPSARFGGRPDSLVFSHAQFCLSLWWRSAAASRGRITSISFCGVPTPFFDFF
jgi:hypothetical protein